jgi:hypothetical protein
MLVNCCDCVKLMTRKGEWGEGESERERGGQVRKTRNEVAYNYLYAHYS